MQTNQMPTFADILNKSYNLFRQDFMALFSISLVASILMQLCKAQVMQNVKVIDETMTVQDPTSLFLFMCLIFVIVVLSGALLLLRINSVWQQQPFSFAHAIKYTLFKLPPLMVAAISSMIAIVAGLYLFVFPGLIALVFFFVYQPAILFDQQSGVKSLAYSFNLVKPHFLATSGVVSVFIILNVLPGMILEGIVMPFISDNKLLFQGIEVAVSAVFLPYIKALVLTQFYALKIK